MRSASSIQGLRFLLGLRAATGGLVGTCVRLGCAVGTGLVIGNANVGEGNADVAPGVIGKGDAVPLGDGKGVGVGLGVGEGRMIFSQ